MNRRSSAAGCGAPIVIALSSRWVPVVAMLFALFAAHPARAIVFQDTTAETAGLGAGQSFLDGEAKLVVTLSNGSQDGCTGSLLAGGQYVLTAAHCVTGDTGTLSATSIQLAFANAGISQTTTSYIVDPTWNGSLTNGGDLSLIKLGTAITSIVGYQLNTTSSAVGDIVTLAGYGDTGVGSSGYTANTFGTLHYGANQYDGVYGNAPTSYEYDFDQYGTNTYNVTGGPAVGTNEAMIAPGDSGGASLIQVGGAWEIVGVHDFIDCTTTNCTPNSSFGQLGGDTSVYADAAWLNATLPEPASASLLAVGLVGLAVASRRRRPNTRRVR